MMNCGTGMFIVAFAVGLVSAQSTLEMNEQACKSYQAADKTLNQVYEQILRARVDDKNFVDAFKAAERAWLVFRDAQIKAVYPEPGDPLVVYGRMHPACSCALLEEMTVERTKELRKRWIEGITEGDVCAGSSARRPG